MRIVARIIAVVVIAGYIWLFTGIMNLYLAIFLAIVFTTGPTMWMAFCYDKQKQAITHKQQALLEVWRFRFFFPVIFAALFVFDLTSRGLQSRGIERPINLICTLIIELIILVLIPYLWINPHNTSA